MHPFKINPGEPNFAIAVGRFAADTIENSAAFLKGDFPSFGQFDFAIGLDADVMLVTIRFKDSGILVGGQMPTSEFSALKSTVGAARSYAELRTRTELDSYFGWNEVLLALDAHGDSVDWMAATEAVVAWLNDVPLRRALNHNRQRVQAAIPSPPQYDLKRMQDALWVLECPETCIQGTAFDLGSCVVTNHHVVHGTRAMIAFRAHDVLRRFPVIIAAQNPVLDLAIINIPGAERPNPLVKEEDEPAYRSHVAVCGLPNYRLGDSGVLTPGLVIGTRPVSGIRRLLTNAPIIAGMSGGPVIGGKGTVIGVCVTGADNFQTASTTEDHGIIPISALEILKG